jgi:wyosine [tRNA(Phe)-imidazoG37] synthetase (radical SAM superfamily)
MRPFVATPTMETAAPLGIAYGPFPSRQDRRVLGVNLMPSGRKTCPMDCLYCPCGWTDVRTDEIGDRRALFPSRNVVRTEMIRRLESLCEDGGPPYEISFAGNGEPTLHPAFPAIAADAAALRNEYAPNAKLTIVTCGALLDRPGVSDGLLRFDRVVVKMDAGTESVFRRLNRPVPSVTFPRLLSVLSSAGGPRIRATFVRGLVDNSQPAEIAYWIGAVSVIRPREVEVCTVPNHPAASRTLRVSPERLAQIADEAREALGVPVRAVH